MIQVYFTDFFDVSPEKLEKYGAFNISLINDLPVFIDPFLIFNSEKDDYRDLHEKIIRYVIFLRDKSIKGYLSEGMLKSWFYFKEVKQTWIGYALNGNNGSGLSKKFATSLHSNLKTVFANFGNEDITHSSHLEKFSLVDSGIGRDLISDFTTNLIKEYLLEYTEKFCKIYISSKYLRTFMVNKVRFNYVTETWESKQYNLPYYKNDYVLLTPTDMLTRDDTWINKADMLSRYHYLVDSVENDQLRAQINNYLTNILKEFKDPKRKEVEWAKNEVVKYFPTLIEYYILQKENSGDKATVVSDKKVDEVKKLFIEQLGQFINTLNTNTNFYRSTGDTYEEARERILFLKREIEHNDGYRSFYVDKIPIKKEEHLQIIYRLTWYGNPMDVNREPNNGRGPVDFAISYGKSNKTLVEFKLASNSKLKRNLENQVKIYETANQTKKSLKVIMYFSQQEYDNVKKILKDLKLENDENIILIDARMDNKTSASKV